MKHAQPSIKAHSRKNSKYMTLFSASKGSSQAKWAFILLNQGSIYLETAFRASPLPIYSILHTERSLLREVVSHSLHLESCQTLHVGGRRSVSVNLGKRPYLSAIKRSKLHQRNNEDLRVKFIDRRKGYIPPWDSSTNSVVSICECVLYKHVTFSTPIHSQLNPNHLCSPSEYNRNTTEKLTQNESLSIHISPYFQYDVWRCRLPVPNGH